MKNLKLNCYFIAALLIMTGIFFEWAAIAAAIVVLGNSENEWLKKIMVRLLVVIFVFYMMSAGVGVLEQLILLLKRVVKLPANLTYNMIAVATLLKYCYMGLMALKAYQGKVLTISFIEKIVEKVYQSEKRKSLDAIDECCPKCGNKWNEGDVFCQKCGTKRQ